MLKSSFQFVNLAQQIRCYSAKHWNPKFRKLRAAKFIKPELPDYDNMLRPPRDTPEERKRRREENIKEGVSPPMTFEYKPISITNSGEIFDPYVPPEGEGKLSYLSKDGVMDLVARGKRKIQRHVGKIKQYDKSFDTNTFGDIAKSIYIKAHEAFARRENTDEILEFMTEHAYSKMVSNMRYKTIRWEWIDLLEEPEVKTCIAAPITGKENYYGQVTVKLHSQQKLAIYDRFGRLTFGNEHLVKDVLEYVVFERHLDSQYGKWRMHDKVEPDWLPPKSTVIRTYVQPKPYKVDERITEEDEKKTSKFNKEALDKEEAAAVGSGGGQQEQQPPKPQLAA